MSLELFRQVAKLSQQELGRKIERSKSYVSGLECGALRAPLRIALQLEDMSEGQVAADTLLDETDRQLLQRHRERAVHGARQGHAA